MKYIKINELPNYMDKAILIDVRMPNEYNTTHLNNAINIPVSNILSGIKRYDKNQTIILYCDYGKRSLMAARLLNSVGYNNLFILKK